MFSIRAKLMKDDLPFLHQLDAAVLSTMAWLSLHRIDHAVSVSLSC
jgi:hypothetical protein